MVLVSLIFLFVYLFGAYAYGAATFLTIGQAKSLWGMDKTYAPNIRQRIDKASLAVFVISTTWFVLHALIEFRNLTGNTRTGWLDLGTFIAFLFPPVIMHTIYLEAHSEGSTPPPRFFGLMLPAMYIISPLLGAVLMLAIFDVVPAPPSLGPWIGVAIGSMFTIASLYSMTLMLRREKRRMTPEQSRLRGVMVFLFITLITLFATQTFLRDDRLLIYVLDRASRAAPIYFMIASIYYEDRFAFYDLVIKRGLTLLLSVIVLAVFLTPTLPWLEALPAGGARPWLFAVALTPLAMVMPWLLTRTERWLDRMWFGREFTPVEAVKHVLAAMQPATDEKSLIEAAEGRLGDIFGSKIVVLVGAKANEPVDAATTLEVAVTSPVSGEALRLAVVRQPGARRILSEDLAMLRSLAGVFGFMLENIRLQRKRQEQDQLAQELRLQSSKSELKALRAQINPHFLFNALNAIASLIHTDPGRADEAVEQLAEVFRYTLRRSDSEWAPLDQELTFARAYLDVEQARFGQRLACTIDSDHLVPVPLVPSMMLQTLLENAVKHGVSQARGPGRIDVVVRTTSDQVTLEVRNTGPAHSTRGGVYAAPRAGQGREGEGFGLHNVRERLKGHFGDRASFGLSRDEAAGITIARVAMPHVKVAA